MKNSTPKCATCGMPAPIGQRQCKPCHAVYMRKWRKDQKQKKAA